MIIQSTFTRGQENIYTPLQMVRNCVIAILFVNVVIVIIMLFHSIAGERLAEKRKT